MVISLIKQAEDSLINFQVVAKERLSKFELLLKCCCKVFQQLLHTDFVSNRELFKVLQRIASATKLKVTFCEKRNVICCVRYVSDIWCGSQAVEHSYAILLSLV